MLGKQNNTSKQASKDELDQMAPLKQRPNIKINHPIIVWGKYIATKSLHSSDKVPHVNHRMSDHLLPQNSELRH